MENNSLQSGFGFIQMIQLATAKNHNLMCNDDEDIKQTLTVTADGQCTLSRFCYDKANKSLRMNARESFSVSQQVASDVFRSIECFCSNVTDMPPHAPGKGEWQLVLTNTDGNMLILSGLTDCDSFFDTSAVSNKVRELLGRNDLFLFDGNPVSLSEFMFSYHSRTCDGCDSEEVLFIDSENGILKYETTSDSFCLKTEIKDKVAVSALTESFDMDAMSIVHGNPPDVIKDPLEEQTYVIELTGNDGSKRQFSGSFDLKGLPECWGEFIPAVSEYLARIGCGAVFDERRYTRQLPRSSEYIFCSVVFRSGGTPYSYLARDSSYCVGDYVVVPAGTDNHEMKGQITAIHYCSENDPLYPIRMTKYILRKYDGDFDYDD